MFSFLSNKKPKSVSINQGEYTLEVQPKETILQAALRENVNIPHSCRVGGCATCKCKLSSGKVKELTEASYVLSDEELDQGYILACQSVPKSDLSLDVAFDTAPLTHPAKKVNGKITSQWKLTHDITGIEIELEEGIEYTAGQYAELTIPGHCSEPRSYSFASPAQITNSTSIFFYVKRVDGGALSTVINDEDLMGSRVTVEGPLGNFHLREDNAPLLFIAGGSGLAPIKAILEQAQADDVERDATFLFGARTQQDLYCLDYIHDIARSWKKTFTFLPVLSHEPEDSNWSGLRGMVTEAITKTITGKEQAYLCGPPGMIDASIDELRKYSISTADIYFDKFLSKADI